MTRALLIPPLPTPFSPTGDLDLDALDTLIEALTPAVDGFLVLGSNGEAVYLSEEERVEVLRRARAAIPQDKVMIAGTGGEATHLVRKRNEEAAEIGVDYALVLPPHYYQGRMTEEVLLRHYRTLADASPLPLMLYNIPASTTLALSPGLITQLAEHSTIVGLKDSSGNLPNLTETVRRVPEGFTVFTGNASTLLPALSLGAKGGILAVANVAAKGYREIISAFEGGEIDRARSLQLAFNPLALAVTSRYGIPGLKAALRAQGLPGGLPRAPLQDVNKEEEREIGGLLEETRRALTAPVV